MQGFAGCVFDDQHGPPGFAQQLQRAQRPGAIQVVLKLIFLCQPFDALESWMLRVVQYWQERVRIAFAIAAQQSAENALGVFPKYLHSGISVTCIRESRCCSHRSSSAAETAVVKITARSRRGTGY